MIVADALPERNARITRHEVQNAVAEKLSEHADATTLERLTDAVLAHDELVFVHAPEHAEAGWEQEWTTRRLLALEAELTQLYQPVPDPSRALDPTVVATTLRRLDRPLGPDQADTVSLVCTQGRSVEVVVGRAGTGKTYTMRTVREVYEAAGQHPVGVCPTARAARELADGARIESFIVPRFVGDHHQLPEIAAGGGFRAALDALGDQRWELTINRRQHHQWEHAALDHLPDGDLATFWNLYNEHERVVLADTASEVRNRAIHDWWNTHHRRQRSFDCRDTLRGQLLNALARQRAAASGRLTGPVLTVRTREFQVGDRIVLGRNMPGQVDLDTSRHCRVDDGMIGTIAHISKQRDDGCSSSCSARNCGGPVR